MNAFCIYDFYTWREKHGLMTISLICFIKKSWKLRYFWNYSKFNSITVITRYFDLPRWFSVNGILMSWLSVLNVWDIWLIWKCKHCFLFNSVCKSIMKLTFSSLVQSLFILYLKTKKQLLMYINTFCFTDGTHYSLK